MHTDVPGPLRVLTLSQFRYSLTFVDDYKKRTLLYFLKQKSKINQTVHDFAELVERQISKTVKSLQTDNDGKYGSQM